MRVISVVVAMSALGGAGAQAQNFGLQPLDPVTANFIRKLTGKDLPPEDVTSSLPPIATLATELDDLFDKNGCDLTSRMKKDIADKFKTKALIPQDLAEILGPKALAAPLQKFPDKTANAALHSVTIFALGGYKQLTLTGAESYKTRSASDYLDSQTSDFAYTMDCSGYLNAAFAAGITAGAADIASKSAAALKSSRSLVVMRGNVFSPTAAAMEPSIGGALMTNRQRLDLLYAIVAEIRSIQLSALASGIVAPEAQLTDATPITSWRKVDMLWTSNQGDGSMTGSVSMSGSGGGGLGLASLNASAGSGGSVARQVAFKQFNTYILDAKVDEPVQRTLGQMKTRLQDEVRRLQARSTSTIDSKIAVVYEDMPEKACLLPWAASTATNKSPGWLATTYDRQYGCKVTFEKAPGFTERAVVDLKTTAMGVELAFQMLLP